jgi:hypothetical protein
LSSEPWPHLPRGGWEGFVFGKGFLTSMGKIAENSNPVLGSPENCHLHLTLPSRDSDRCPAQLEYVFFFCPLLPHLCVCVCVCGFVLFLCCFSFSVLGFELRTRICWAGALPPEPLLQPSLLLVVIQVVLFFTQTTFLLCSRDDRRAPPHPARLLR